MDVCFNEQGKNGMYMQIKAFRCEKTLKRSEIIGIVDVVMKLLNTDFHENINKLNVYLQIYIKIILIFDFATLIFRERGSYLSFGTL